MFRCIRTDYDSYYYLCFCIDSQNDDHTSYEMSPLRYIENTRKTKPDNNSMIFKFQFLYCMCSVYIRLYIRFRLGSFPFSLESSLFQKKNKAHTIMYTFGSFSSRFCSCFTSSSAVADTRARTLHVLKYLCDKFFQELATCIKQSGIMAPSVSVSVCCCVHKMHLIRSQCILRKSSQANSENERQATIGRTVDRAS